MTAHCESFRNSFVKFSLFRGKILMNRFYAVIIPVSTVLLLVTSNQGIPEEDPIMNIEDRRQLFVDRYLVARTKGAELQLHKPVMREVVMVYDRPWEGNTCGYFTIFRDGEVYRMYYRAWHHKNKKEMHPPYVCCAESNNGIEWTRPELGIVSFRGSKKNNIILKGKGTHNFVPFKDLNPACRPDETYKAFGGVHKEGGVFAFSSEDGIRWKLMSVKPVITSKQFAFDSQNVPFWDSERGEYRAYFRAWRKGVRDIKTAVSKDFLHWSRPVWLTYPDAPREHLYTNQVQPYYRAPQILIGFPSRYIEERGSLVEGLFMSSRGGRKFIRRPEAIIRPGRNRDRWHNRSNYIWLGLVETESDLPGGVKELSLYTNESYYKGRGVKTRRYTYRLDGFVSVSAPLSGGEMVSKPFIFKGNCLRINFSSSAAGAVKCELQNKDGRAFSGFKQSDCDELFGDDHDRIVTWNKRWNIAEYAGKAVRLRFILHDADLYAFRFGLK
mgnify:CR=1 FL=1